MESPKNRTRIIILAVAVAVVGLAAFVLLVIGGAFFLTGGVAEAGDTFMTALQDENLDEVYALMAPTLQVMVEEATLEEFFANLEVESWRFTSRSVENNRGQLLGRTTINGDSFRLQLTFINEDGTWLVTGYDFSPAS